MSRRGYLDWLRGVAVLIMVEAHLFDAWVRVIDRSQHPYQWAMVVGGFSAPLFLFLAGVAMALGAGSRLRKGLTASETAAIARRRGWQILGLAFLFRLQSFIISGGPFPETLLKVDILNVMGLSMVLAAVLWGIGSRNIWRGAALASVALIFAMVTPLVRSAPLVASLPYPFQWYFKAVAGSGAFTLFPWVGFLLLGVVIGLWLDRTRTYDDERRVIRAMAIAGPAIGVAGYLSMALPPIYSGTTFWTGSPTYFFVRLGVLITTIPIAYAWNASFRGWSPLRDFGIASLFIYWIHVEMVYGVVSFWLHKALTFEQAMLSYIAFSLFLYGLVKLKDRFVRSPVSPPPPSLAPSHGT
ncbi:MAG TPA: heparan-alpha-glucosaminide N-acetyltransferase domain-containing protein [Vicinamibacterales bacterium]|nr:heparan-alpha-glucosaminide N-acetyltransferase domain-containing protein [Vicinamibacterales bacterium]